MRQFCIIRFSVLLGLSIGLYAGPPAGMSCAFAQSSDGRGLELVSRAAKSYEAGAYTDAAASIDEAFKAGLSNELAARAILLRAQVNEKNGALARALQDYSNALWMETLPSAERKKAKEGKERVIAAMGLSSAQQASSAGTQSVQPTATESSGSSVFGMFNGIFGSSSTKKPDTPPAAEPPKSSQTVAAVAAEAPPKKAAVAAPAKPPKPANAVKSAPAPTSVAKAASLQPASASSIASDGFLIVFGSANSQAAGRSKAQQIKAKLSDILVNRNLDVEASPSGGFQIVAGPYKAKSAALALCSAMKQRGVSCQVTP
jgi:cell division protein FtsN